jgi:hypothetical protein
MTRASILRRLVLFVGAGWLCACSPAPGNEPPPRTVREVPTPADAAPPPVPLTGRGVIVPSDVKLEPTQNLPPAMADPTLRSPVAGPGSN